MNPRSCLQYAVINYFPRIGKYTNKHKLYRKFLPRRVKGIKMTDIENTLCMRIVMNVTPLFEIEIESWGAAIIL